MNLNIFNLNTNPIFKYINYQYISVYNKEVNDIIYIYKGFNYGNRRYFGLVKVYTENGLFLEHEGQITINKNNILLQAI